MLKPLFAATIFAAAFAASAIAQDTSTALDAALPAVDTMTCEQMQAEMMSAGQRMNAQLDPNFGTEAQAMYDEAQQKQREAQAQAPVNALACMIPFACAVAQQHAQQQSQAEAAQNQARVQAQMDRLNASMDGIDQQRMQAISARWDSQHCQAPQQ